MVPVVDYVPAPTRNKTHARRSSKMDKVSVVVPKQADKRQNGENRPVENNSGDELLKQFQSYPPVPRKKPTANIVPFAKALENQAQQGRQKHQDLI
jgi:hypothetical protein